MWRCTIARAERVVCNRLTNIGTLDFHGIVEILFTGGYVPLPGATFDLFDFGHFTGGFDRIAVAGFDAAKLDFSHLASRDRRQGERGAAAGGGVAVRGRLCRAGSQGGAAAETYAQGSERLFVDAAKIPPIPVDKSGFPASRRKRDGPPVDSPPWCVPLFVARPRSGYASQWRCPGCVCRSKRVGKRAP